MPERKIKNCTIRDLAKYVGLSTCTVSKVMNDKRGGCSIPEATRKLVREAAAKLNYVPNVNAQRLFQRRSRVIGLLVPTFQDETDNTVFLDQHLALIMGGMTQALQRTDYNLMMIFNSQEIRENGRFESMFRSHLLDGLLIWGIQQEDFYWKELVNMRTPTLFLTTTPGRMSETSFNYISNDYEYAGYQAAKHLLAQGSVRPLWLMPLVNTSVKDEFEHGILHALKEGGLDARQLQAIPCEYSQFNMVQILKNMENCDGIIALSDNVARSIAHIRTDLGMNIPMVCLDAAENCVVPNVPTIVPQDKLIGQTAVETILRMIEAQNDAAAGVQKRIQGNMIGF